jgi:peroxiredoxin Q/BCP
MKKFHALFAALLPLGAAAALQAGEPAPDFQLPAAFDGHPQAFSLHEALQHGPVVVYFYPAAYTKGCNLQAHTFSENQERFAAAGATIIGVSLDGIERLKQFSADPDYCAGRIAVASDADGKVARAYALNIREAQSGRQDTRGQAIDHGFAERTTFVVGRDGRVVASIGGLAPVENVQKALEVVQHLAHGGS